MSQLRGRTFLPSRDSAMVRDVSVFSRMVGRLGLPMLAAISARALAISASWSFRACSGSRFCGRDIKWRVLVAVPLGHQRLVVPLRLLRVPFL